VEARFFKPAHRAMIVVEREPRALLEQLARYSAPQTDIGWIAARPEVRFVHCKFYSKHRSAHLRRITTIAIKTGQPARRL